MENNGKGLSIAALVLGIIACLLCWWGWVGIVALILGIVGIILAVKGKQQAIASGSPTGLATAGLVLSIIATAISGIVFVSCTLCIACAGTAANSLM